MSYQGVIRIAEEYDYIKTDWVDIDWLKVVKGCYELAVEVKGERFAEAWVTDKVGYFPSLQILVRYGILKKEGETVRQGAKAYYSMPDVEGTGRALREVGYI